jgi:hypothetical protein
LLALVRVLFTFSSKVIKMFISIKERLNIQKKENRGGKGQKIVIARTEIRSQASKNGLTLGMSVANPLDYRG